MVSVIDSSYIKKSIKEHRCNYCGGTIEKGASYYKDTCVFDGEIYTWKSHPECMEIGNVIFRNELNVDEGVSSDDFNDFVYDILTEKCGYTKETIGQMSISERVSVVYNKLKENNFKI